MTHDAKHPRCTVSDGFDGFDGFRVLGPIAILTVSNLLCFTMFSTLTGTEFISDGFDGPPNRGPFRQYIIDVLRVVSNIPHFAVLTVAPHPPGQDRDGGRCGSPVFSRNGSVKVIKSHRGAKKVGTS